MNLSQHLPKDFPGTWALLLTLLLAASGCTSEAENEAAKKSPTKSANPAKAANSAAAAAPAKTVRTSWPMFRGSPGLLGISDERLPDALALAWKFKTGGPVKSSPAVVDGRVFIGSDDENIYALALVDGKKLWNFKTEGPIESSPLVLQDRVYIGSSDGLLYALDAASGKLLWKHKTEDKILGAPNWVKSPQGDATWILAGSYDYKLHCVDAVTGKSNWGL